MADIHVMREGFLPPKPPPRRHLISIGDLTRDDVERLLATARSFSRSLEREVKKLPTLRGYTVVVPVDASLDATDYEMAIGQYQILNQNSANATNEPLKTRASTLSRTDLISFK